LKSRLLLLWSIVALFVVGTGIGLVWFDHQIQREEFERTQREAVLANDTFVEHTRQIVGQADNLLRAVRSYYLHTRSIQQTDEFIASLGLEKSLYENIYLIDAGGKVVIAHEAVAKGRNTADREYFRFHSATPEDVIYFAPTDKGRVTNQTYFRITRRISLPDGAFGGVLVLNVRPSALTDYFARLSQWADSSVALVGIRDRKIRARYPEPEASIYDQVLETPLWAALAQAASGTYRNLSRVDGTVRQFAYKQVGDLPLAMVTGFSDTDVQSRVVERLRLIAVAAASAVALVILLAFILTLIVRQRQTQERYLTELKDANDRSTALFNATHDAVILLDGERSIDCNPEALRMFGAPSKEESLGQPPWSPSIAPPQQPDGSDTEAYARQAIEAAFRHGTHRFEYLQKRIDTGEEFLVDIMLTAIQFNGKPILQSVLRDITERARFEREIRFANKELARRNEEQDRFLSMLSHELKTPLAVIRMSLGTAADAIDAASRARLIRAVADINAIVERCLQTDRLEHGRIEVVQARCNPADILRQIVGACSEPQRVRMAVPALPDCATDVQLLTVILANLIDNALKYSPHESPVEITAELTAELTALPATQGGKAGLTFIITNPPGTAGMPDPQQVFHRYYRAPGAHGKTGSGLGLHIAEGFARMLGGELSCQPEDNTVKFVLWIPN
jgi:PAS domain S-box-containing protein